MTAPLIFQATADRLGIRPDDIYKNCARLVQFDYPATRAPRATIAPRPGQRPVNKRKRNRK